MIDRVSPTHRPDRKVAGYQEWRSLLFMHWPVAIRDLRPLVPAALELDLFDGVAYVGLVPFSMHGVRPVWAPAPMGFNFLETNVRTYVVYQGRPGVYFFSLDAASRLAVMVAKKVWGLPYHFARMGLEVDSQVHHYRSVRADSQQLLRVSYQVGDRLSPSLPQSLDYFFLERYLLFLEYKGSVFTGQVHHKPYPVQAASILDLEDELLVAAGIESCHGFPEFVHYSPGVDVEIFALQTDEGG